MQDAKEKPDQDGPPHVITVERAGWRVGHRPPGGRTDGEPAYGKAEATKIAAGAAKELADKVGETVELQIQDAQGRTIATRYIRPTTSPKPEK